MTDFKKRSKTQRDPEVSQSPDFLNNTPPGEVFQNEAIPLSEDIKTCRHVMNVYSTLQLVFS